MADEKKTKHWTEKLQGFDRRWIFLAMGLAIILPLIFPLNLPVKPSPMTQAAYYTVESIKPGDRVFVSVDLDPASTPELEPYFKSVILQLKRHGAKLVIATTWYAAPPLIARWIRDYVEKPLAPDDRAYKKNEDYVYLGYRAGDQAAINDFASDLRGCFDGHTADGQTFDQVPILGGIKQLKDFPMLVLVSAGFPGIKEYVQQVGSKFPDLRMVGATTAVSTTDLAPYYQTGQIKGLVGGLAAAAEYEGMVGNKGLATQAADVLNVSQIMVIVAIVFGNFIYFAGKRRKRA